jgi:DNA-binding CsgD family transcriptional regulator
VPTSLVAVDFTRAGPDRLYDEVRTGRRGGDDVDADDGRRAALDVLGLVLTVRRPEAVPAAIVAAVAAAIPCERVVLTIPNSDHTVSCWSSAAGPTSAPRRYVAATSFRLPDRRIAALTLDRPHPDFDPQERARLVTIARHLSTVTRFTLMWRDRPDALPILTPSERRVLGIVALGLTDRAAARRLGIAEATVHKHLEHAYRKLGVTNRVAATRALHAPGS